MAYDILMQDEQPVEDDGMPTEQPVEDDGLEGGDNNGMDAPAI